MDASAAAPIILPQKPAGRSPPSRGRKNDPASRQGTLPVSHDPALRRMRPDAERSTPHSLRPAARARPQGQGGRTGKLLSPARRRTCVQHVKAEFGVSERRACAALGQHRSTQRKPAKGRDDEAALTADIVELAKAYGRYGYRRITALLRHAGWAVNAKRVQRIWRREGLKVPHKQPKRGRLWLNDGSCVRLRAERPNHVWSYDFVEDRTHDGRKFRMLCVIDEFTRQALAIKVKRRLNSTACWRLWPI